MVCWRRQHSFCKEKFCLVDLLELRVHVIRARREDPAGVAQSRFENGSDKIPHQKLSRNRTCHRMGEKTHRKLEAGQNRVNSKAQRLSSKEGDFFHDRDGISQSMQRVTVRKFIKEKKSRPCRQQGRPSEARAVGELESREQRGLTACTVCCSSSALHAVLFPQRWVESKFSASPSCSSSLSVWVASRSHSGFMPPLPMPRAQELRGSQAPVTDEGCRGQSKERPLLPLRAASQPPSAPPTQPSISITRGASGGNV